MSLPLLFRERYRPAAFTAAWLKAWCKRAFHLRSLCSVLARRAWLQAWGAQLGELSLMQARVPLRNLRRLTVGKGSYVAPTAELGLHAEIRIGSGVVINAGAKLLTGSHNTRSPLWELVSRPIVVGDHAWVAVNAMILPGVRIGRAAVVGAGAVVSRDVPDFAVVAGNPAREVGRRGPGPFRYWGSSSVAAFEAWLGPDPELSLHHD